MRKPALQVLVEARIKIARHWIRGSFYSRGYVCALGAIGTIRGCPVEELDKFDYDHDPAVMALLKAMPGDYRPEAHAAEATPDIIMDFNENAKTKRRDLLAVFDLAIERLRRRKRNLKTMFPAAVQKRVPKRALARA